MRNTHTSVYGVYFFFFSFFFYGVYFSFPTLFLRTLEFSWALQPIPGVQSVKRSEIINVAISSGLEKSERGLSRFDRAYFLFFAGRGFSPSV